MGTQKITSEQENEVLELYGTATYQKIADIVGVTKNQVVEVFRRNNMFKHNYSYDDFIGKRFDKLVVITIDEDRRKTSTKKNYWKCLCDCGSIVSRDGWYLANKQYHSCGCENKHIERIGEEKVDKYGTIAKIIEYKDCHNITIEYQDKYKYQQITTYQNFCNNDFVNPYAPTVYNIGIVGSKYPSIINKKENTKEYGSWCNMLTRCYNEKFKEKQQTYKDVTCCEEWLLYENFYEWLHSQENFEQWYNGINWAVDKDILFKGNKIYSPDTCCLVPDYINAIFHDSKSIRAELPIGVRKHKNKYIASCIYGKKNNRAKITRYSYPTIEDAFYLGYKPSKEAYIKRVAQEEYDKGNITEKCYNAMINYQVEITD